jgi:hypothetical protein
MANAQIAEQNLNWEEVLKGISPESQPKSEPQYKPRQPEPFYEEDDEGQFDWDRSPPPQGSHSNRQEIELLFSFAFGNTPQYSSFYQFLTSINQYWHRKGFLTQKQYEALRRAARR